MTDQIPGSVCTHCGRTIPVPEPAVLDIATDEPAIEPQDGHVDNVGDESEIETIDP